jgi:membrane dipeptidase
MIDGMNRRRFLYSAGALAIGTWPGAAALHAQGSAKPLRFVDVHTHIGMYRTPLHVRDAMAKNGVLLITRKIVGDGAVIRRVPTGFQMFRKPEPGELFQRYESTLSQLKVQHKNEGVFEVASAETLARAINAGEPAAAIGVEGGDFLEGDLKRLDSARQQGIVHLQLVHYRVSELGDISTERPVHGGLTPFGKDVVSACNRLGILVDVAHGTSDVIDQTLALSSKPVIYSHGQVSTASPHYTQSNMRARAIHRPLALKIAKQGGVIGIWPLGNMYATLDAYAQALMDTAEYLGANHVAVGTDIPSLLQSPMPDYEAYPALEEALSKRGVKADDIAAMLGRNYLRVLQQALSV